MLFSDTQIADLQLKLRQTSFFSRHELVWLRETGSTNNDLKLDWRLSELPVKFEIAEMQTNGRGQFERVWKNGSDQCLMFSFAFQAAAPAFPVSLIAGIAVCSAIRRFCVEVPAGLWLKWPNDVFYARRKLAGILVEASVFADQVRFVVGIGVNLKSLGGAGVASAGLDEIVAAVSPAEFLHAFCLEWDTCFSLAAEELAVIWAEYASVFWNTDFLLTSPDGCECQVRPLGIDSSGALSVVEKNGTRRTVFSGSLKPLFSGLFDGNADLVSE